MGGKKDLREDRKRKERREEEGAAIEGKKKDKRSERDR